MTGKFGDQGLDTLERRFQALRDQLAAMPEAYRPELEGALQKLSQAIAALRPDREAQARQAGKKPSPVNPEAKPTTCEAMLHHVFNAIPDLLTVHDRDFNTIMSNWRGYESVPEADRRGRPKCYRVYHHRDRPCDNCHVLEVLATGQPAKVEKVNPVDGRVREVSAFPIRDESGRVVLVAEHVRDITERRLAEQALKDSEATLRTLIEANPESLFLLDTRGVILAASRVAAQRLGKNLEEILGADLHGMLPPEVSKKRFEIMQGVAATGQPARFEDVRGGFYFDSSITPIFDQDKVVQVAVLGVDISLRKQAEAAVQESEARFRMLFDHVPDAYILADMQGEIIDCNQATEELAGYGREELIGNNFACLPWLDFRQQVRLADLLAQTAHGEVMGPVDFTLTRKDGGEAIAEGMSLPLFIQGQNLVLTIVRDITARKRAEEELGKHHLELQETAQQLEQSRNMLQLIIESIPARVFWKDINLRYLGCNTLFARDAGFNQPQQLLGQDDFAMGWREQADLYRTDDRRVMESRRPKMNIVEPQTTPAGTKIWLKTSKVPLQRPNGEVFGVLGVYEDVTGLQQAEGALAEQRELMDYVIRHDPNAIAVYDNELRYVFVSERYLNDYGIQETDIIGKHHYEVFPEMPQRWKEVHQRVLAGAVEGSDDDYFERPDGSITYNRWECRPWYRAGGGIGGMVTYTEVTTARKLAEMALRESEQRFRDITENAAEWVWEVDAQGKFTYSSPVVEQLLGYKPQEILGKYFYDFFLPDEREELKNSALAAFAAKQTFRDFLNSNLHKDGRTVQLSTSGIPILNEQGNLLGYRGADIDITARKQAEEALAAHLQFLQLLLDTIPNPIFFKDVQGVYLGCNKAFENYFGVTRQEIIGKSVYDLSPKELADEYHRMDLEAFQTTGIQVYESRVQAADGAQRHVVFHKATFPSPTGGLGGLVGIITDITGLKQTERELRKSEQRFRLMAETIQEVFWMSTAGIGETVYVSPAYEHIWGRTCEALYRNPKLFMEVIHPEDRERVTPEILAAQTQGTPWSHEYRIIQPDGAVRWIHDRGYPVRDDQGRVILFTGVATDITERKALEGQLLQAQKMEAVGRLAGGVAHDFNNLLMAITGYGELMRAKVLKDDPLYGYLENILNAGDRAAALTQQLLTFSRQKIVHPQVIDLNRVVLDLEPMLRRLIGEDLDLEVVTDRRPGAVKADPGQMGQIIMNLVVNARDAMPQGGRLTLKTEVVDLTEGFHSRFGLAPPGAYVMLVAQDNGVGMDAATQAHVFEPFFTTKEPGKGTGLGLSTVYGIVKQSGGYLDLESSPGAGSTFTIYLPRLEAKVEPPKAKIPITASFRGEETVLLVEDEDVLRSLLAKFLRLYGYTVLEARHGGEALLTCERHPGPIHVMVTDVVMPQMSGRELADRLTPLRPEMKVLYMSGYTEDALVQHGVADLSVAFLQKPFRPIELARRVYAVLHPPVSQ